MNRDDLQLFMTILEENNLIKASEQLYLSPSTAGSRLRAMEEELGYPLFERRKGVKSALPTSRGLAFSHIASQMLALWNEADQIGGMSDSPFLTIATVDSFLDYNLTPFYRELISLHGFSLDIKCYPADMIYSLVSSKQADVGFALYDISTPHVNVTPLSEDDMVLVVPEGSGLIPAEDCPAQPVHPSVLPPDRELFTGSSANSNIGWGPQFKLWHDRYIRSGSRPLVTATSISILNDFLEAGDYWTIMPYTTAMGLKKQYPVRILPLSPAPPRRTLYMLKHNTPSRISLENMALFTGYLNEYLDRKASIGSASIAPGQSQQRYF